MVLTLLQLLKPKYEIGDDYLRPCPTAIRCVEHQGKMPNATGPTALNAEEPLYVIGNFYQIVIGIAKINGEQLSHGARLFNRPIYDWDGKLGQMANHFF